jgi:hypothetical protein
MATAYWRDLRMPECAGMSLERVSDISRSLCQPDGSNRSGVATAVSRLSW